MLSVAEAVAQIVANTARLEVERLPLLDSAGRVLADDAYSPLTIPPWTNSAMDGYAVRAEDIAAASESSPVVLPVVEMIKAGNKPHHPLRPGEAMRIMTGAPLPDGADTVVRQEDTDMGAGRVAIRNARDAKKNLRFRGEDVQEGSLVLAEGTPIAAAQIGVLASMGMSAVNVFRAPRVAIIGSGDELVDLDQFHEAMAGERIVSSNAYTLQALVRANGAVPVNCGTAQDTPKSMREHFARAAGCDLIVTTAGISVGEHDHVRHVLEEMGADLKFWRIRMRPGAPVGFGLVKGTPWIGLPGNPVSTMVTFELFVRPAIRKMMGFTRLYRRPVQVTLEEPVSIGARLTHFLRAVVRVRDDGSLGARLTGPQGSGILTSMAKANALLIIPEDRPRAEAGETANALLLGEDAGLAEQFAL